jgi:hypothetical protein
MTPRKSKRPAAPAATRRSDLLSGDMSAAFKALQKDRRRGKALLASLELRLAALKKVQSLSFVAETYFAAFEMACAEAEGCKVEAAVQRTMESAGLSRRRVYEIRRTSRTMIDGLKSELHAGHFTGPHMAALLEPMRQVEALARSTEQAVQYLLGAALKLTDEG